MGVKFFGQYLLEKHIITPQQLIEAVEYQESKNLKLGDYALSKGYLKKIDILKIQNEQKRVDLQFGETAVKLNLLTPEQVQELLTMQKNDYVYIGEALVIKAFVSREVVDRELALFKEDQSKYASGEIPLLSGIENPEVVRDMVDLTQKMLQRVVCLPVKIGDGFIDHREPLTNFLLISISVYGSLQYDYVFSCSQEIAEIISSAIIGEEMKGGPKEYIIDGVKEFCNITCGNIIAKLSQRGKKTDISPPQEVTLSTEGYRIVNGRKAAYYPLVSPEGDSILIVVEG